MARPGERGQAVSGGHAASTSLARSRRRPRSPSKRRTSAATGARARRSHLGANPSAEYGGAGRRVRAVTGRWEGRQGAAPHTGAGHRSASSPTDPGTRLAGPGTAPPGRSQCSGSGRRNDTRTGADTASRPGCEEPPGEGRPPGSERHVRLATHATREWSRALPSHRGERPPAAPFQTQPPDLGPTFPSMARWAGGGKRAVAGRPLLLVGRRGKMLAIAAEPRACNGPRPGVIVDSTAPNRGR